MSEDRRLDTVLWPALGLGLIALFAAQVSANPEAWTAAALGRHVLAHGVPAREPLLFSAPDSVWLYGSWLHGVVVSLLWSRDAQALSGLLHLVAVVAGFAFLIPVVRAWCRGPALLATLALTGVLLDPGLLHTPRAFAVGFIGVAVWVAHRPRPLGQVLSILLPLQVAWVNVHPSFLLGPVIVALFAWERREPAAPGDPVSVRLAPWIPALAMVACALLNPYGPRLLVWTARNLVADLTDPASADAFLATTVPPFGTALHAGFSWRVVVNFSYAVAALGLLSERQRLPFAVSALAAGAAAAALFRPMLIRPLFAVLMFPMLALSAGSVLEAAKTQAARMFGPDAGKLRAAGAGAALLAGLLAAGAAIRPGPAGVRVGLTPAPRHSEALAEVLGRLGPARRPLHLAVDGGPLAWLRPDTRVFRDTRRHGGAPAGSLLATAPFGGDGDQTALAEATAADLLLVPGHWPQGPGAIARLREDPDWVMAWFDGDSAVFVPAALAPPLAPAIGELRDEGLGRIDDLYRKARDRIAGGQRPDRPATLLAAAQVFRDIGDIGRAKALYQTLADGGEASSAPVQAGLGYCALAEDRASDAVEHFRRAAALDPRRPGVWDMLATAYEQAGDPRRADDARRRGGGTDRHP